jgi:corrinoid protein of di/trimethylamine methyltransferase
MEDLSKLYNAVVEGKIDEASRLTKQALLNGIEAGILLNRHLIPAMTEVGKRFEEGEYYLPDMLVSTQAMKNAQEILKPAITKSGMEPIGKVAIGTIKGDLHDIGKNLVAAMLEGNGFEVYNLGVDVRAVQFVEAVRKFKVDIIAISALLTTTMVNMKEVIKALESDSLRNQVRVIIGGAPITESYAVDIGADGFHENANGAVMLATSLLPKQS